MSESNPHAFNLTIPQDVAADVSYTALISVESNDLPQQATAIAIDRTPMAFFTMKPRP